MKKYLIKWQKWVDPFGDDLDEAEWTDYEGQSSGMRQVLNDEDLEDSFNDDPETQPKKKHKSMKVVVSPMGLIPYNEHTASSKIFNFWIGHANFNLSKAVADCIEQIEGVETLDIFTRYRFRISIGKCFNDAETMSKINHTIYDLLENIS